MKEVHRCLSEGLLELPLIRLCQQADRHTLNAWENLPRQILPDSRIFAQLLADEQAIPLAEMERAPLALIRALDTHVAGRTNQIAYLKPLSVDGASFWLMPVRLLGREHTAPARQKGSKAAWFKRHADVPTRTTGGIEV